MSAISLKAQLSAPALFPHPSRLHIVSLLVSSVHKTPQISCRILHLPTIHGCAILLSRYKKVLYLTPMLLQGFLWPSPSSGWQQKSALIIKALCAVTVLFPAKYLPAFRMTSAGDLCGERALPFHPLAWLELY